MMNLSQSKIAIKKYLLKTCSDTAMNSPAEVFNARRKFLNLDSESHTQLLASRSQAQLEKKLQSIARRFWSESAVSTRKQLLSLESRRLNSFTNLQRQQQQLLQLTELREQWPEISSHQQMDPRFLEWVQYLLIATPAQAQIQLTNLLYDENLKNRERVRYRNSAQTLLTYIPMDWSDIRRLITPIAHLKLNTDSNQPISQEASSTHRSELSGRQYFVIIIAIVIVIRLLTAIVQSQ